MSWSFPRLNFKPHRDSRSSEASVSRPLFCIAIRRRTDGSRWGGSSIELQPDRDSTVAAVAGEKIACDAAYGGDADAGLLVDFPVGQTPFQQLDNGPAVGHRLQFRRRAQVTE